MNGARRNYRRRDPRYVVQKKSQPNCGAREVRIDPELVHQHGGEQQDDGGKREGDEVRDFDRRDGGAEETHAAPPAAGLRARSMWRPRPFYWISEIAFISFATTSLGSCA